MCALVHICIILQAGAGIRVVCLVNEQWVEGEIEGKTGIFPASFVDCVPPDLPEKAANTEPPQPAKVYTIHSVVCVCVYVYTQHNYGGMCVHSFILPTANWQVRGII